MGEHAIRSRARAIASRSGVSEALAPGIPQPRVDVSLSEGVVIGLLKQVVRKFFGILGHGNTDIGEVLRIYGEEGALRFLQCRNEVAMAHAATLLAWDYGETPALLSSIGPGSLQAYAGSLVAASNRRCAPSRHADCSQAILCRSVLSVPADQYTAESHTATQPGKPSGPSVASAIGARREHALSAGRRPLLSSARIALEAGGMETFGRWNVGPCVPEVERLYADQII